MSLRRIACAYLVLVALAAIAGAVGGLGMQLELWSPEAVAHASRYERLLTVHGALLSAALGAPALAGALGYVVIADTAGATRLPAPLLAGAGLVAWAVGLAASAVAIASPTSFTLAPAGFAASGVITAVHLALVFAPRARALPRTTAGLAAAFILSVGVASAAALDTALRAVPHDAILVGTTAIAVAALATLAVLRDPATPLWHRPAAAVVGLGAIPAAVVYLYAREVLGGTSRDIYLHDTYFVVGAYHGFAATAAFTALAALVAWAEPILGRAPRPWLVRFGTALCSAGILVHIIAALRLGAAGMPRRYATYAPEYTDLHRLGGIGAVIALAGAVLLLFAVARGARMAPGGSDS